MAYDYEKSKKLYESLTPEQQKKFAQDTTGQVQDFLKQYNAEKSQPANTQTVTYNGKVGNSTNVISKQSQNNNAINAKVGTGEVAGMPEQPKVETVKTSPITVESLGKSWDALTYAEQQKRLTANPGLKEKLASKGIVSKTEPEKTTATPTSTTKTTTTPKQTAQQDKWDYQDNSQARMDQIADNLDKYRQNMPALFDDMSAFYNFFIKDKGRSQDQIDFLWDYFNRVQKYGKYDNYSSAQLGDKLANGKIPADYLDYLKSTDPNKYAEVMAYKQEEEDTITYESYLSDIADQAGLGGFEAFYKGIFGYKDENQDGIDDGSYIAPTEEETTKQNRINTIDSRAMEIKNMQKNLLDDLVEQYPGVPKATLMGIVQDRTKDLQREYDDLMVERAGLVGSVEYLQNERDAQMKARQSTINNLEKAYGMYYDYTAEGIAEMAQNKYAATNITLDQAENGTDTQKQMALEGVLTPLYEKYGSIIQRSPAQVINDVMALAKKEGISLADAFEKNFMSQLRSKPQFATLSSGGSIGGTDKWTDIKVKDAKGNEITLKMNQSTGEIANLDGTPYTGKIQTTTVGGASFTPVSYSKMYSEGEALRKEYAAGSSYKNGWCGELMNLYLQRIGSDIRFGDGVETKTKWITNDDPNSTPAVGSIVVWDYSDNPNVTKVARDSGHVAMVTNINPDGSFEVYEQNGDGKHQVGYRTIKSRDYIAGFIDPAATPGTTAGGEGGDITDATYEVNALSWIPMQLRNTEVEKEWFLDILSKMKETGMNAFDAAMSLIGFTVTNKSAEAQNVKNKILGAIRSAGSEDIFDGPSMQNMANAINAGDYDLALQTLENKVNNFISSKGLTNVISTRIQPTMATVDTLRGLDVPGWKTGTVQSALNEGRLQNITSTQILSLRGDLRKKLRDLGYEDDELQDILPNLNDTKNDFIQKLDNIEDNILLDTMNSWRRIYGLPNMTTDVILGDDSITSLYKISNSDQLTNKIKQKGKSAATLFNR